MTNILNSKKSNQLVQKSNLNVISKRESRF